MNCTTSEVPHSTVQKTFSTYFEVKVAGDGFSQSSPFESQLHGEGNLKFTSDDPGRNWWNRFLGVLMLSTLLGCREVGHYLYKEIEMPLFDGQLQIQVRTTPKDDDTCA